MTLAALCVLACASASKAAGQADQLKLPDFETQLAPPPTQSTPDDAVVQQVVVPMPTSAATGFVGLAALGLVGLRRPLARFFT